MPRKGTKKVREHTRKKTVVSFGSYKFKDPLRTTHVKTRYPKKCKG